MTTGLRPSSFNSNNSTASIANNYNNNNNNSSHDAVAASSSPQSLKLYQVVIFATPVLFAIILVLLFILFYLRRRRIRLVNARIRAQFLAGALFSPPGEQGLSKSFRAKLPIIPYDESFAASTENTQCAVCLDEYAAGDKIQQLPVCGHAFHVECIDEWLAANLTCPICRTSCLLPPTPHGSSKLVTPSDASMMSGGDSSRGLAGAGSASRRWEERILSEIQDATNTNNHLFSIVASNNNNTNSSNVGGSNNSSGHNTMSSNSLWMIRRDGSSIRGSNNNSNSNGSSLSDTALRVVNSEIFVHAINIERS